MASHHLTRRRLLGTGAALGAAAVAPTAREPRRAAAQEFAGRSITVG